jgi:hypothetical protein
MFKKGSVVLCKEMHTQLGKVTAKDGHELVSVFLGSVPHGEDPEPARRMHDLGWRQMSFFEAAIRLTSDIPDQGIQELNEWRIVYACLGAVDAVEAAARFANKLVADGGGLPHISSLYVGTMKIGPIDENGVPFNGRGPAYFGWKKDQGVTLEQHIQALREEAQRRSQL